MYHVSAQGVDERMINVHYYYYCLVFYLRNANKQTKQLCKSNRIRDPSHIWMCRLISQ